MEWLNEPASWQRTGDVLTVSVDPGTDFWRETGYGYIRDSGHVYGEVLAGDLDVTVRLRGVLGSQFDQAGVMLRADEETWIKTGVEFFEGRPRLSTVLTLGRSSWMVTDLAEGCDDMSLRVSRRGDAVEVRYQLAGGPAELAALVYMPPGRAVLAGVMCAAPEGPGFRISFHDLHIAERDWAGQAEDGAADWAGEQEPGWAAAAGAAAEWAAPAAGEWAGEDAAGEWADQNAPAKWEGEGPEGAGGGQEEAGEGPAPEWAAGTAAAGWAGEPVSTEDPGDDPAEDEPGWLEDPGDSVADHAEWVKELARDDDDPEWAVAGAHPAPATADEPGAPPAGRAAHDETGGEPTGPDGGDGAVAETSPDGEPVTGNGRQGAVVRPPAGLPGPPDPADEWISLLTADPAEE